MVPGRPVYLVSSASVVGKKEGEGPLGKKFDVVEQDAMFGAPNWEQAESAMQKQAADLALEKRDIHRKDVRYLFAGDLISTFRCLDFMERVRQSGRRLVLEACVSGQGMPTVCLRSLPVIMRPQRSSFGFRLDMGVRDRRVPRGL